MKALYRIRVKSLQNPDGVERVVCRQCAEHASYIADSQGPRWYIRGNPFEYVDTHTEKVMGFTNFPKSCGEGECPDCESTRQSEARIIANIEGITYSAALGSIR